jgi:hypothetical protein
VKSKYVIIEVDGVEMPLIFSRLLSHENVALALCASVHSAGYCELDITGKWTTGGQSVSLELDSRPEDAELLNQEFRASSIASTESFRLLNVK